MIRAIMIRMPDNVPSAVKGACALSSIRITTGVEDAFMESSLNVGMGVHCFFSEDRRRRTRLFEKDRVRLPENPAVRCDQNGCSCPVAVLFTDSRSFRGREGRAFPKRTLGDST